MSGAPSGFPPVDSLLPHRGVMALLVAIVARPGPETLVCRGRIGAGDRSTAEAGTASILLAVEMGAQAAGALEGLRRTGEEGSPRPGETRDPAPIGYLVGLRGVRFFAPALPVATDLRVTVRAAGAAPPLGRYEFVVDEEVPGGRPYARGEVTTYLLGRRAATS